MKPITKQVKRINFNLFSPEQVKKLGVAKIVTPELYDMDGYPVDGGLMDLRLGAIDPGVRCRTCGGRLKECLGHFGYIELARPIMHIKYAGMIETLLRSTCEKCSKILLTEEEIKKHGIKKAKDVKKCPFCGTKQQKIKLEKPTSLYEAKKRIFPSEIRARLARISDEDCKLFDINPRTARPEWAVLTLLLVPPVTVRPSITLETGERSEDDLTHKLGDIIRANQRLWENLNAGAPEVIIEDLWDLLQYHVTTFFDNSVSQVPPARHRSGQPLKTIVERIKGKEGRIRHNLAGKRVNFSSRSVISPDPFIALNEIGIPLEIAKVLTVSEMATKTNIENLKSIVMSTKYPCANYIIRPDGKKKQITDELREELVEELSPGYIVERQLQEGDIVLFNRHPSLHRASLMAHYVKIMPGHTFRLHPGATVPYNADFDGDEMNVHSMQTEEARAESKILLDVKQHLFSPKNNSNVFGCVSDALTGNFLLSQSTLDKKELAQLFYEADLDKLPEGTTGTSFGIEKSALIKEFDRKIGRDATLALLKKIFNLGSNYLSRKGFTISLTDLTVKENIMQKRKEIIQEAEDKVKQLVEAFYTKKLELLPGKTDVETREIKILQTLNATRSKIGGIIKKEISKKNPVNIMIQSGAGGNILYVTQMACSVGQQALWAQRINLGYTNRTLSFFKRHDLSPRAHGFIYSSYLDGLEPDEFFFGAVTGRDSLMDTALRTPKSGYLYRRLANALQDLKVEYDGTVRDASSRIVQFSYGEDGFDVSKLHLPEKDRKITPGEAIGIITAQSFGEPSTQMTLNVFHFAGVSEMTVTTGLPRLIEIFDARKKPSTPVMEIYLTKEYNNAESVKKIAERIRAVKVKDIAKEIIINFTDKMVSILLDPHAVKTAHITDESVCKSLKEKGFKTKLKQDRIVIKVIKEARDFKELYKIKEKIKEIKIAGIKGIEQVLPVKRDDNYVILTAGSNLADVFEVKGIDKNKTTTNNIHEIAEVLGIEAARQAIIHETEKVLEEQGLDVDKRHIMLVADAMTANGEIKGITRIGIISRKASILARASFETPIKFFVNASIRGEHDDLVSVIENIMLNQPVPVGTGLPGLFVKVTGRLVREEKQGEEEEKVKREEKAEKPEEK